MPAIRDFSRVITTTAATSITCDLPDYQANDLLLFMVSVDTATGAIVTAPSAEGTWTQLAFSSTNAPGTIIYGRIMTGTTATTVSVTWTNSETANACVISVRDVDTNATLSGNSIHAISAITSVTGFSGTAPTVSVSKANCLVLYHVTNYGATSVNGAALAIPSFIEGPVTLLYAADGANHSDGVGWTVNAPASGTTPNNVKVSQLVAASPTQYVVTIAVAGPTGGATVIPGYCAADLSSYINPLNGTTTYNNHGAWAGSATTYFGTTLDRNIVPAGTTLGNAATVTALTDYGVNPFHSAARITGPTNKTWFGAALPIGTGSFPNCTGKNVICHVMPSTPVSIQTTMPVTALKAAGIAFGMSSSATAVAWKMFHVHGAETAFGVSRTPIVINSSANTGVIQSAAQFTGSSGAGTFTAGQYIYVGSTWATATKRGVISVVGGTTAAPIITYSLIANSSGVFSEFANGDAVKEYTGTANGDATCTAGTPTVLNPASLQAFGFAVASNVTAPIWAFASLWMLDTTTVAGGNSAEPLDMPQIVRAAATGHERMSVIQQGASQMLLMQPIQIGNGGTAPVYLKLENTAIEIPAQYNKSTKQVFYCSADNVAGITYYAGASDTIIHRNSVVSSPNKFHWVIHASSSGSATYDFSNLKIIGAGTVTMNSGVTLTSVTFDSCDQIASVGNTFTTCTFNQSTAIATQGALNIVSSGADNTAKISYLNTHVGKLSSCTFSNNTTPEGALRIEYTGTAQAVSLDMANVKFSGNTKDIYWVAPSGCNLTLNLTAGANPTTYTATNGNTVSFSQSNAFTISNVYPGSEIRVFRTSDQVELCGVETIGTSTPSNGVVADDTENTGKKKFTYTHANSSLAVYVVVIHDSYQYLRQDYTLKNETQNLLVSQIIDRNYSDPNG